ncbi:hypothetical protein AVEN_3132-1, partial [Araneus ventricosus]
LDQILGKAGSKAKDVYESKVSLACRIVKVERTVEEIDSKLEQLIEMYLSDRVNFPPNSIGTPQSLPSPICCTPPPSAVPILSAVPKPKRSILHKEHSSSEGTSPSVPRSIHRKKSHGVRYGDLEGHGNRGTSSISALPIQRCGCSLLRKSWTFVQTISFTKLAKPTQNALVTRYSFSVFV